MIYHRTLLAGIESLKSGVTSILDDVMEVPHQGLEQLGSVFRAYDEIGYYRYTLKNACTPKRKED